MFMINLPFVHGFCPTHRYFNISTSHCCDILVISFLGSTLRFPRYAFRAPQMSQAFKAFAALGKVGLDLRAVQFRPPHGSTLLKLDGLGKRALASPIGWRMMCSTHESCRNMGRTSYSCGFSHLWPIQAMEISRMCI